MRKRPTDASLYYIIGSTLWRDTALRELATDAIRFASTLNDKNETYVSSYVICQRYAKRIDEALADLKKRAERLRHKSAGPTITYFNALRSISRFDQGLAFLNDSLAEKPDDGDLLLLAATEYGVQGQTARAHKMLEQAEGVTRKVDWLRAKATLDEYEGELHSALSDWRKIVDVEPLNIAAHEQVARLLHSLEGFEPTNHYLDEICQRYPYREDLWSLRYNYLRHYDLAEAEATLSKAIQINPIFAWAIRELGVISVQQGRLDEGRSLWTQAVELEPDHPGVMHLEAMIADQQGRKDDAISAYRRAIILDPDDEYAISQLLESSPDVDRRIEAAKFIVEQMSSSTIAGEGILVFQHLANDVMNPQEVLAVVQDCVAHRPDLCTAHVALVRQWVRLNLLDQALATANAAVDAFPLVAGLWVEKATVHHARIEPEDCGTALREALSVDVKHNGAIHELANLYMRQGKIDAALQCMNEAIRRDPRNPEYHGLHGSLLWSADRQEEAVESIEHALDLSPDMGGLWERYRYYCDHLTRHDRAVSFAREVVRKRPGMGLLWLHLAGVLNRPEEMSEALEAVEQAIRLNPRNQEAHEKKVELLVALGRFEESATACRPPAFGDCPATNLRFREAWVLAQRGMIDQAIESLQTLLQSQPGYWRGWRQLCDWAREQNDLDLYMDGARQMVALAAHEPTSLMYAGHAHEVAANSSSCSGEECSNLIQDATEYYRRSFELDPTLGSSGELLLRLYSDAGRFDEAEDIYRRLAPHYYPGYALAERIKLDLAKGNVKSAIELLPDLVNQAGNDPWPLKRAVETMHDALSGRDRLAAIITLRLASQQTDSSVHVGTALIYLHALARRWEDAFSEARRLRDRPNVWRAAATELLEQIKSEPKVNILLGKFLKKNRALFAQTGSPEADRLWGLAIESAINTRGYFNTPNYTLAFQLADSWQARSHPSPWMLLNAAHASLGLKKYSSANEILSAALQLPSDDSRSALMTWQAWIEITSNHYDKAAQWLELVNPQNLNPYFRFFYYCVEAVLVAHQANEPSKGLQQSRSILKIAQSSLKSWRSYRMPAQAMSMARRRVARRVGGLAAWLELLRSLNWI